MKNSRTLKRLLAVISTTCLLIAAIFVMNPESVEAAASSGTWDVHVQPGYYRQTSVVPIVNHGNGYVATCTSISGDCASMRTTIVEYANLACTSKVTIDKTVAFTKTGSSITFKAASMPSVDVVYMKATLTYSNGSTAAMSGTIRIK